MLRFASDIDLYRCRPSTDDTIRFIEKRIKQFV